MAVINILGRGAGGAVRNVDLSQNTLWVDVLRVGASSPTDLTKAILDNLILLQNGSDAGSLHNHDGRYYTEAEIADDTDGQSGASLVGVSGTPVNYSPADPNVQAHLEAIDAALAGAGGTDFADDTFRISDDGDDSKKIAFEAAGISTATTRTITMPDANVDLGNLTNSNIASAAAIAYSKLALTGSIVNADINAAAAIVYSKLSLANSIVNADIAAAAAIALSKLAALTAGRALVSDGSGVIAVSAVTATELGALAGIDSNVQDQLDAKIDESEKGANNGVATLDAGGKIPVAQLPSAVMTYEGVWDADQNDPELEDGTGDAGMVYLVSVAGTQDLGSGPQTFEVGDWVVYNGSIWQKSTNSNAVVSVNGQTGVVSLDTGDISENGNLYFTDERAQDAVGGIVANSSKISLTYNDGTPNIVADVIAGSLVNADINAAAAIAYSKLNLAGSILNADINASAGIVYSKLNLAASIVNADVASGAAIAYSKLNLAGSIVNADINASAAIAYSKLALSNSITNADLTTGVADQVTITGGNGSALAAVAAPLARKTMVAGETFAANTSFLVRFALTGETAGRVYKADKDASASNKYMVHGIAHSAAGATAGQNIAVTLLGTHVLGSSDTPFASGDVGKELYLTAAGAFSLTAPSALDEAVVCVGVVENTDRIWVDHKQLRYIN